MSPYRTRETIVAGRYHFDVSIDETYFEGVPGGRMDEMPGTFLKTTVWLSAVDNPSPLEALAAEKRIVLCTSSKEITYEPPGYAALWGDHFLQSLKSNPAQYIRDLQERVKRAL